MRARLLPLLLPLLLAPACTSSRRTDNPVPVDHRADRAIPASLRPDVDAAVKSNTAFALDLYGRIKDRPGNLFCAPYSISSALAMTWAGARGTTETEMATVLHFTLPQERLHPAFGALQKSLDTGNGFGGYRLSIANRLFGQQGYPWLPTFLAVTRDAYGAQLQQVDFLGAPEPSRATINGWVAQRTEGLIPELFPAGTIHSGTRVVLANAIYFKGRWVYQFDPKNTFPGTFQLGQGRTVQVPFMTQSLKARGGFNVGLSILELPYEGQDIAMLILLPSTVDGLAALEGQLSPARLAAWRNNLSEGEFALQMPRFSVRNSYSLAEFLAAMGMPSAFDAQTADLSGMDGVKDLKLEKVLHQALVKVDEEGTVAVAATGVSGAASAPMPTRLDHPFLFLLVDQVTGSILFMGRVADPSMN